MAAKEIYIKGNPLAKLDYQDDVTGVVERYIHRDGTHPNTGKPLSDIVVFEGGLAVNWPKVLDQDTMEPVPWFYFEGELCKGSHAHIWWESDGSFHCDIDA